MFLVTRYYSACGHFFICADTSFVASIVTVGNVPFAIASTRPWGFGV
jgi:hypothetical protein